MTAQEQNQAQVTKTTDKNEDTNSTIVKCVNTESQPNLIRDHDISEDASSVTVVPDELASVGIHKDTKNEVSPTSQFPEKVGLNKDEEIVGSPSKETSASAKNDLLSQEKQGLPALDTKVKTEVQSQSNSGVLLKKSKPVNTIPHSRDYKTMAKRAYSSAQHDRLGGGKKWFWETTMNDIGAKGVGLRLYFMLTKYLSITFLLMGCLGLPAMCLHFFGHGMTDATIDSLMLAKISLGNQGIDPSILNDPTKCKPRGSIDCTGKEVMTPFTTVPETVTKIITWCEVLQILTFVFFILFYAYKAKKVKMENEKENLTPAKYAIYVRGLPATATAEEILQHFNRLYDLSKDEEYNPLWFMCCFGKRRKVKKNMMHDEEAKKFWHPVDNLEHLAAAKSMSEEKKLMYKGTWIAEVSVGHPSGGILQALLSIEALTRAIAYTKAVKAILESEQQAHPEQFNKRDKALLTRSDHNLSKLYKEQSKKKKSIKALEALTIADGSDLPVQQRPSPIPLLGDSKREELKRLAKSGAKVLTKTKQDFNWDATECAFVIFQNLESKRRCMRDYRYSASNILTRYFQPTVLRFKGEHRLWIMPAPEPSNILWENLEITASGRFYRRAVTKLVTLLLLILSGIFISSAKSAQDAFKAQTPPAGLCTTALPQLVYGNNSFMEHGPWNLEWMPSKTCTPDPKGNERFYVAFSNGFLHPQAFNSDETLEEGLCVDPCVSGSSSHMCKTLPCFENTATSPGNGDQCQEYQASNVLYCLCEAKLTESIDSYGFVEGPQKMLTDYIPCREYMTNFLGRKTVTLSASMSVVIVNQVMRILLSKLAAFECHSSETAKAGALVQKLFFAQFLNTAVLVTILNTDLGLSDVPILNKIFKGVYRDFDRGWYPVVGAAITMTMLVNVVLPQVMLLIRIFLFAPLSRFIKKRSVRTQEQMNVLYAGLPFDIALRYPLILNSLFVTMIFCGGMPILLFIAALTAGATYWLDKMSITYLYSVKTTYDAALGDMALDLLPWSLVGHLVVTMWMFGNPNLLQSSVLDLPFILRFFGLTDILNENLDASPEELYKRFLDSTAKIQFVGTDIVVRLVRSNVMVLFVLLLLLLIGMFLSKIWLEIVLPILDYVFTLLKNFIQSCFTGITSPSSTPIKQHSVPEFTQVYRKTIPRNIKIDENLGYRRIANGDVERIWLHETARHGVVRMPDTPMLTWEVMDAPIKIYAIDANEKYQGAVSEIVQASEKIKELNEKGRRSLSCLVQDGKVRPLSAIDTAIIETEPIQIQISKIVESTDKHLLEEENNERNNQTNINELAIANGDSKDVQRNTLQNNENNSDESLKRNVSSGPEQVEVAEMTKEDKCNIIKTDEPENIKQAEVLINTAVVEELQRDTTAAMNKSTIFENASANSTNTTSTISHAFEVAPIDANVVQKLMVETKSADTAAISDQVVAEEAKSTFQTMTESIRERILDQAMEVVESALDIMEEAS